MGMRCFERSPWPGWEVPNGGIKIRLNYFNEFLTAILSLDNLSAIAAVRMNIICV
jgi:hypothetical protein